MQNAHMGRRTKLLTDIPGEYHETRRHAWNRNAAFWSAYLRCDQLHDLVHDRVQAMLTSHPSAIRNAVDFGCGDGRFIRLFLTELGCDRILGIDFSESMLKEATHYTDDPVVQYECLDAESELPAPLAKFDACIALFVLDEIEEVNNFFRNVSSYMAPNGVAILSVLDPDIEAKRYNATGNSGKRLALGNGSCPVIAKHFSVGHMQSPEPYFRILRRLDKYHDAAKRYGLAVEGESLIPPPQFEWNGISPVIHVFSYRMPKDNRTVNHSIHAQA